MGLSATAVQLSPLDRNSLTLSGGDTWRAAYKAALFEADLNKIEGCIRHAEQLILMRERQLFGPESDPAERRSLSGALTALSALRMCLEL